MRARRVDGSNNGTANKAQDSGRDLSGFRN